MTTIETKGLEPRTRDLLYHEGFELHDLDDGYWNIICEDEKVDNLTTWLENLEGVEWRLV